MFACQQQVGAVVTPTQVLPESMKVICICESETLHRVGVSVGLRVGGGGVKLGAGVLGVGLGVSVGENVVLGVGGAVGVSVAVAVGVGAAGKKMERKTSSAALEDALPVQA